MDSPRDLKTGLAQPRPCLSSVQGRPMRWLSREKMGHWFSQNFRSPSVRFVFFSRVSRHLPQNVRLVQNGGGLSVQFFAVTDASISRRDSHRPDRLAHGAASWEADRTPWWRHDSDIYARRRHNDGVMTAACEVSFYARTSNVSPGSQWWK